MRRLQVHENQDSLSTELGSPSGCPGTPFNTKRQALQARTKVTQEVTVAVPGSPPHGSSVWALGTPHREPSHPWTGLSFWVGVRGGSGFPACPRKRPQMLWPGPSAVPACQAWARTLRGKPPCRRWLKFCILSHPPPEEALPFFFFSPKQEELKKKS